MNDIDNLTFTDKIRLLVQALPDEQGKPYSPAQIASAAGISDQTLLNLLNGRLENPRLETLQKLCAFYGISLAYFDCPTAEACAAYLANQRVAQASPLIHEIAARAASLSDQGKANVLTVLTWMEMASR